ncbi:hypothetical protein BGX27_003929 [Mortierella sp. AM989]|nr:hypothetical protein BGX27_003929 [Mortierella sp. AM989]
MRFVQLALAFSLSFVLVAFAAPAPAPIPQQTEEEFKCVDECLAMEEECLLNSIGMSECVMSFDKCHMECVPEAPAKPEPAPPKEPKEPTISHNESHKNITNETDVSNPTPTTETKEGPALTEEEETVEEQYEDSDYIDIGPPEGGEDDEEFDDETPDY